MKYATASKQDPPFYDQFVILPPLLYPLGPNVLPYLCLCGINALFG
jgi:hypothetical protein